MGVPEASTHAQAARVTLRGQDAAGRPFDLGSLRGQPVAVTFASRHTRAEAARVNEALVPLAVAGEVVVVNAVDLRAVPGVFRAYARRQIAAHDLAGRVLHLVDESGAAWQPLGVEPERRVDILIFDAAGALRGRFSGLSGLPAARRLLEELIPRRARPGLTPRPHGGMPSGK
jgi:hypothetical protein